MIKNNSVKNNLFDSYNIKYILKKEKSKKNKNNNKNDKNIKDNFQKNENENSGNNVNCKEEVKNKFNAIIDNFVEKNNKLKQLFYKTLNNLKNNFLLYQEKVINEKKKKNKIKNRNNEYDIKNFVHAKINTKYNNSLYNKIINIKKMESNIFNIILYKVINEKKEKKNKKEKIIQEKLKQQKQIHILLKLIRDLINIYGNLSHLYENDSNKKILLKSLFLRYNIKEKEDNKNIHIIDIYNKMINEIKRENYKNKINKLKKEEFKVIKEENETEEENNDTE
jgi:hypothetical protein